MPALKVVLHLSCQPWGGDGGRDGAPPPVLHSVICAGSLVPECWFTRSRGGGWLVSGFATGSYAVALAAMPRELLLSAFLRQLAAALPGATVEGLRGSLLHSTIFDWAAQPYIRGGYSAPSTSELPDARALYRKPEVGGRIVFAGEATEEAMMTMNAAIDSGRRAAAELLSGALAARLGGAADKPVSASGLTTPVRARL
jgi:monoamine oxidase